LTRWPGGGSNPCKQEASQVKKYAYGKGGRPCESGKKLYRIKKMIVGPKELFVEEKREKWSFWGGSGKRTGQPAIKERLGSKNLVGAIRTHP